MKYYALKFKKLPHKNASKYATLMTSSMVDAEIEYHIDTSNMNPLLVFNTKQKAEKAANNTVEWYNSDPDTPVNSYVGEFDVVEFQLP